MAALAKKHTRILGVDFFSGSVEEAINRLKHGGLLVVPAAPALKELTHDLAYREALLHADLAIADSAYMVMIWNFLEGDNVTRLSGLRYLRALLKEDDFRRPGNTLWVMAGEASANRNLEYLRTLGINVPPNCVYLAPMYSEPLEDPALLEQIESLRPRNIMVTVGGGTQEKLGFYLKRNLSYLPAIHCTGAAIAFLSGDQVAIPGWADKYYMGWLVRTLSNPRRFLPRYWGARKLFRLILRYRDQLPASAE